MQINSPHAPVMLDEVLTNLNPQDGKIYVDGTFGAGGYSRAILESNKNCKIIAIDRDREAENFANKLRQEFLPRFVFCQGNFSDLAKILKDLEIPKIDGLILDIGVSSMQLDLHHRGFSFDSNHRLDMRMDQTQKLDAFEVVNSFSPEDLAEIIRKFGDEPKAKLIAKEIVKRRVNKPIETCMELASIVRYFYHKHYAKDPATKTFQAIRIFVNNELQELELALNSSSALLAEGGKLIIVTFHSLEDKIVKKFLQKEAMENTGYSRYQTIPDSISQKSNFVEGSDFRIITKKPAIPSDAEVKTNPRSRSAKMRVAIKLK
jgi:16S rRNA (cytosine1402-N4)-methyltransferase